MKSNPAFSSYNFFDIINFISKNNDFSKLLVDYNYIKLNEYFKIELFTKYFSVGYKHIYNSITKENLDISKIGAFVFTGQDIPSKASFIKSYLSHKILFNYLADNNIKITLRDLGFKYLNQNVVINIIKSDEEKQCTLEDNILHIYINQKFDIWANVRKKLNSLIENLELIKNECEYIECYDKAREAIPKEFYSINEFSEINYKSAEFNSYNLKLANELDKLLSERLLTEAFLKDYNTKESLFLDIAKVITSTFINLFQWDQYILFPSTILNSNNNNNYTIFIKERIIEKDTLIRIHNYLNLEMAEISIAFYSYLLRQANIRSAKAAIMSRNMSHNLGSHVMYYLKLKLGNVYNILTNNVLKEIVNFNKVNGELSCHFNSTNCNLINELARAISDRELMESKISFPFLIGLGRFINYLQERMDFIATVSTNYIPYLMTVNFKDTVFDELTYDLKMKRHQETESFRGRTVDNILLDNIVRSEGLCRDNISIQFGDFDGLNSKYAELENQSLIRLRELDIDLPGGQTGRQAIFSILENFIRNSAKHSPRSLTDTAFKLIIYFDVIESEYPELYKFTIWNNLNDAGTISNNEGENVKKLREAISEEYVNDSGEMIGTNKGIKEMKISAAWLRGIMDEEKANPPVLQALNIEGSIGYEFFVLKPQKVAIISNSNNEICESINKEIIKFGWRIFSVADFLSEKPQHKLVILDETILDDKLLNQIYKISHSRVINIKLDEEYISSLSQHEFREQEYIKLYEKHVETIIKISNDDFYKIHIDDMVNEPSVFDNQKIKIKVGELVDSHCICFKKHFLCDSINLVEDNEIASNENYAFIESISGSNSTDRLIRKAQYDQNWYLQMHESALTRIAIFDERLWSDYTQISNDILDNFFNTKIYSEEFIIQLAQQLRGINKEDQYRYLVDQFPFLQETPQIDYELWEILNHSDDHHYDVERVINIIEPILRCRNISTLSSNQLNSLLLEKKNLRIFTIVRKENEYLIINHKFDSEEANNDIKNQTFTKVGVIRMNGSGEIEVLNNNLDKFHFISIHQGILDKIYETLKIKNNFEKMNDLTNKLEKAFCFKSPNKTLKNVVIHSGRSKPAIQDMPQEIPFVQYSSLENAIKDCKFSLTELLYSARFDYH